MFRILLLVWVISSACATLMPKSSIFYDSFTGNSISIEKVKEHVKKNSSFWCVNEVIPCHPSEGRRVDGSCNNLKYPTRGSTHTPMMRLLPAEYDDDFEPRRSESGDPLPLSRSVRTTLLAEGRVPDSSTTTLLLHFWVFIASDVLSIHDTINYLLWKTHCCEEKGKTDKACIPIKVPDDDPVHRFNSIRCLNLTRPESFQSTGCLKSHTTPEKITSATPLIDLSPIYGISTEVLNTKIRLFQNGMLKYEMDRGRMWPPSTNKTANVCLLNKPPHETRCHDTPELTANSINLLFVWSWRLHNHIAIKLAKLNPCWNDDRLFYQTREIVIAIIVQIYYYELMPVVMGYENLVHDGVLSKNKGFRDMYNDEVIPQMSIEYPFTLRWVHTAQDANLKLFDLNGNYMEETKIVNFTLRTGYLGENIDYITQGVIRQPTARFDYVVDPDMAETVLGPLQLVSDVFSSDLTKNRYYGLPPYIKYRKFCSGKTYKTFEDLLEIMDPERVRLLQEKYKNVADIDLLAGIWMEKPLPGGRVPHTFYCLITDQLIRNTVSDRHWYERHNRPNAFSLDQLLEIRKATIAEILCGVGDKVTIIQPKAFYLAGPGNEMVSCDDIEKINLYRWKDKTCRQEPDNYENFFV